MKREKDKLVTMKCSLNGVTIMDPVTGKIENVSPITKDTYLDQDGQMHINIWEEDEDDYE